MKKNELNSLLFSKFIGSISKGSVFQDLQVATDVVVPHNVSKTSCILICFPWPFWQVTSVQNFR